MKLFLQAVAAFHRDDYAHRVAALAASHAPCGLFYLGPAERLGWHLRYMKEQGLRVTLVVTLGDALPHAPVRVIRAEDFAAWQAKPSVMFLYQAGFACCFAPFFERFGIESLVLSDLRRVREVVDFYDAHLPELYGAYELFHDEASQQAFLGALCAQSSSRILDCRFAPEPQYFLDGFTVRPGDIVIDGGAYDGATARAFAAAAGKDGHVYAFEMDEENLPRCKEAGARYGFTVEALGLAARTRKERYVRSGGAGDASRRSADGDRVAQFVSLDDYVLSRDVPRLDFIKMDIEGAELDALRGAAASIQHWKPRMAICAYHKDDDLWTLPSYIRSLRPDYEFAFRHYPIDVSDYVFTDEMRAVLASFDLPYQEPMIYERVLYCR